MSQGALRAVSSVPTGNTFDKYGSSNPLVRWLMGSFERTTYELIERASPTSILDVGCGEGILSLKWARRLGIASVVGLDLPDPRLQEQWRLRRQPNLKFVTGRAEELPFGAGEFEMVAAIETLEHLPDPERALTEMARVARRHLLVSVPREPVWRMLNIARGAYLDQLGNTPGHMHHYSKRDLERLLALHGEIVEVRTPLPWAMALVYIG